MVTPKNAATLKRTQKTCPIWTSPVLASPVQPADKAVAKALEYCDEPLSGVLFVGDTIVDIRTAQKMKVKSVLINRDNNFKLEADYRITGLNQLFDIITESNEKQKE